MSDEAAFMAYFGSGVSVCGVEEHGDGGVRMFVGPRYHWRFFLAYGEDADESRRAWASRGHVVIDRRAIGPFNSEVWRSMPVHDPPSSPSPSSSGTEPR